MLPKSRTAHVLDKMRRFYFSFGDRRTNDQLDVHDIVSMSCMPGSCFTKAAKFGCNRRTVWRMQSGVAMVALILQDILLRRMLRYNCGCGVAYISMDVASRYLPFI